MGPLLEFYLGFKRVFMGFLMLFHGIFPMETSESMKN